MNIEIAGIVQSQPKPVDDKRTTFILYQKDERRNISCMSSLRFDAQDCPKQGEFIKLAGEWKTDPSSREETHFVFDIIF